jgi:hypothetical protein
VTRQRTHQRNCVSLRAPAPVQLLRRAPRSLRAAADTRTVSHTQLHRACAASAVFPCLLFQRGQLLRLALRAVQRDQPQRERTARVGAHVGGDAGGSQQKHWRRERKVGHLRGAPVAQEAHIPARAHSA